MSRNNTDLLHYRFLEFHDNTSVVYFREDPYYLEIVGELSGRIHKFLAKAAKDRSMLELLSRRVTSKPEWLVGASHFISNSIQINLSTSYGIEFSYLQYYLSSLSSSSIENYFELMLVLPESDCVFYATNVPDSGDFIPHAELILNPGTDTKLFPIELSELHDVIEFFFDDNSLAEPAF